MDTQGSTVSRVEKCLAFCYTKRSIGETKREQLELKKEYQKTYDSIVTATDELQEQLIELKKKQANEVFWQDRRYQEVQYQQQIERLIQKQRQLNQEEELVEGQQIQLAVLTNKIISSQ